MQATEIINRSKKNLTNKFTNMSVEKISGATQDKYQFGIINNTTKARRIALIPGYSEYPILKETIEAMTDDVEVVTAVDFTAETVEKATLNHIDVAKLDIKMNIVRASLLSQAGYPTDVVLVDGTVTMRDDSKTVVMTAQNSTKRIADFMSYIKTNPTVLKEMTIVSSDKTAFASDMEVVKMNPFKRSPEEVIDLNRFFSKYQQVEDRIDIVLDQPLELSDDLLWIITIPAGASMNFTWRF